jgi:hypothetical protein
MLSSPALVLALVLVLALALAVKFNTRLCPSANTRPVGILISANRLSAP